MTTGLLDVGSEIIDMLITIIGLWLGSISLYTEQFRRYGIISIRPMLQGLGSDLTLDPGS